MKTCSMCKRDLPLSEFGSDASRRDGVTVYCKECVSKRNKSAKGRNTPSRRKKWGESVYNYLKIKDSEY
jgi:hypothetical protein